MPIKNSHLMAQRIKNSLQRDYITFGNSDMPIARNTNFRKLVECIAASPALAATVFTKEQKAYIGQYAEEHSLGDCINRLAKIDGYISKLTVGIIRHKESFITATVGYTPIKKKVFI